MELWEGSLHSTLEAAATEGEGAAAVLEDMGMVITDFNVVQHTSGPEEGMYQPTFVYWTAEEYEELGRKRVWPWVVGIGAGLVTLLGIGAVVVYARRRRR